MYLLRLRNATQLVTVTSDGALYKCGSDMDKVEIIPNGTVIVNKQGLIAAIGDAAALQAQFQGATFEQDIDAKGMCVLPGLVDGHTHPVWAGDRVHEFALKLAGATYLDIHKAGGGIGFTVEHTRKATDEELRTLFTERLDRMLKAGTTLAEVKSGYGLDLQTEVRMLEVIQAVSRTHPVELVATYLGAHSVPKGSTAAEYTRDIVTQHLPHIKQLKDRGEINPQNVDVFLEKGVFELDDTRTILQAAINLGFELNFHGDEINFMASGELGGSLAALAISHLEKVSDTGIAAMAKRPTFAVLLPTTAHILRLEPPPARKLISGNVPVALGSDFNPNAHCLSMPYVMNLACVQMRLTMNEALVAATLNAAASMKKSSSHGSLEVGKHADFILLEAPRWEHLTYQLVDPPIYKVIKLGKVVYSRN
jgi:imidazolonepropionase